MMNRLRNLRAYPKSASLIGITLAKKSQNVNTDCAGLRSVTSTTKSKNVKSNYTTSESVT